MVGRLDEALCLRQDVYSERLKVTAKNMKRNLLAANNYADIPCQTKALEEAGTVAQKDVRRATRSRKFGRGHVPYEDKLREGALPRPRRHADSRGRPTTLEETERTARRVLGGAHRAAWLRHTARRASRAPRPGRGAGALVTAKHARTPVDDDLGSRRGSAARASAASPAPSASASRRPRL